MFLLLRKVIIYFGVLGARRGTTFFGTLESNHGTLSFSPGSVTTQAWHESLRLRIPCHSRHY